MTSRARRRTAQRGSGGGGGRGGGGGSRTCDFRVALERGALLGWGGPEGTLRGPAALSVPLGRPRPSLNPSSDRVGEVPPAPHSLAFAGCAELGAATCCTSDLGRGLPWSGPRGPVRLLGLQTSWSRPLPALTSWTPTSRPPWVLPSHLGLRGFRAPEAPGSPLPPPLDCSPLPGMGLRCCAPRSRPLVFCLAFG